MSGSISREPLGTHPPKFQESKFMNQSMRRHKNYCSNPPQTGELELWMYTIVQTSNILYLEADFGLQGSRNIYQKFFFCVFCPENMFSNFCTQNSSVYRPQWRWNANWRDHQNEVASILHEDSNLVQNRWNPEPKWVWMIFFRTFVIFKCSTTGNSPLGAVYQSAEIHGCKTNVKGGEL